MFTRQNRPPGSSLSLGSWEASVILHPSVALRSSTYSYAGDSYGDMTQKKSNAYWNPKNANSHSGSSNEMMVKNSLSVLDDSVIVIFPSVALKNEAIKRYKEKGITSLHGMPLETVFVTSTSEAKAIMPKVWDNILKLEKEKKNG